MIREAPLSIGVLWAWLSALFLIAAFKRRRDGELCVVAGMVSAFIWFMDGHLFLLASLIAITTYFLSNSGVNATQRSILKRVFRNVVLVHAGFVICALFFFLLKAQVFGLEALLSEYTNAAIHRSSLVGNNGEAINLINLSHKLLFVGYQAVSTYKSVIVWKTLLITTALGFLLVILIIIRTSAFYDKYKSYLLILALITVYFCVRLLVVPNHTFVHAYIMSRYLSIPFACVWSALFGYIYLELITKRSSSYV